MDLTGKQFERWKVTLRSTRKRFWGCVCECGTTREVFEGNLIDGRSKSCGCLKAELASVRIRTRRERTTAALLNDDDIIFDNSEEALEDTRRQRAAIAAAGGYHHPRWPQYPEEAIIFEGEPDLG